MSWEIKIDKDFRLLRVKSKIKSLIYFIGGFNKEN